MLLDPNDPQWPVSIPFDVRLRKCEERGKWLAKAQRADELQAQRIRALADFGIKAMKGDTVRGSIKLYATEAGKLIALLKRLSRQ